MDAASAGSRLFDGDVDVFAGSSAASRTGWTHHLADLDETVSRLEETSRRGGGLRHDRTIVLGMGGSSSPAGMFASAHGAHAFDVLDTSNPDTFAATSFQGANVIAASKSGTTIETIAGLAWALGHGLEPRDLTVITDPGTGLSQLAQSLGARLVFGDPATGGRFSALSGFGIFPALAAGWSAEELVASAGPSPVSRDEFVGWFVDGANAVNAPDDLTWFELGAPPFAASGELWLEQLVAESTSKQHRGAVPVVAEHGALVPRASSMARDIYRWHVTVAAMCWKLEVDPFNQPDVDDPKREVLAQLTESLEWSSAPSLTHEELTAADSARYVALQVFGPLSLDHEIEGIRQRLATRFTRVTAGTGPRFLHSTGQLHKGGPDGVVAVQVTLRPRSEPVRIPGRRYSFADLHLAQARADARALRHAGRTVLEFRLENLAEVCTALDV